MTDLSAPAPGAAAAPGETGDAAEDRRRGSGQSPLCAVPVHIAIIMDGNGRWAQSRGLSRSDGHRAGTETALAVVEECVRLGVEYLTLYTFSRENWRRPKAEVAFLFELLVDFITRELPRLEANGVQIRVLGELDELPFTARRALAHAMGKTRRGRRLVLNLALNYSGREEIARACRLYMQSGLPPEELTAAKLSEFLYTAGQPDPDLVIRTSGELRTSNFLPFQSAYSEYYFTPTLWPDFSPEELREACAAYEKRARRFGGLDSGPAEPDGHPQP